VSGELPASTGTVVVGGGIIGAAIAWELARRGEPVALFEAGSFGGESTGKSAAMIRMHYSNPPVVRMALRSRETFANLPEILGCEPVYHQVGWLFLVDHEDAPAARRNREMQVAEGVDSEEVPLDVLPSILPGVSLDGLGCVLHEARSGYADPIPATLAYIRAATRDGARVFEHTPVQRLVSAASGVSGVAVDGTTVSSDRVVLAAGAWSAKLAAAVGIDLQFMVTREQDVIYDTGDVAPVPMPISNQADRIYLRPELATEPPLLLLGRGFPKPYEEVDPDGYRDTVDADFEAEVRSRAVRRFPAFAGMRQVDARVGLYAVPPDWHPHLGRVEAVDGLVLATGGSGHCFKLGPAIAELVVGEIVGEPVGYADIGLFNLSRLRTGSPFSSAFGGNRA